MRLYRQQAGTDPTAQRNTACQRAGKGKGENGRRPEQKEKGGFPARPRRVVVAVAADRGCTCWLVAREKP
ncbi:hypothetical protein GUJ93_ZPchr0008g12333 [Zizania palustris]|uniref:Uncharacterized protein n=1 Tax=Zizania palustris TaxID=103762 RepID=A0A8J5UWX1_ZIZPA|nr:hypothetical protein GUJ93_ZPchr0008g12333 [Zizania palustris]